MFFSTLSQINLDLMIFVKNDSQGKLLPKNNQKRFDSKKCTIVVEIYSHICDKFEIIVGFRAFEIHRLNVGPVFLFCNAVVRLYASETLWRRNCELEISSCRNALPQVTVHSRFMLIK